jgi:hypothetical protein
MDWDVRSLTEGVGALLLVLTLVGCPTPDGAWDEEAPPVVETGCGDALVVADACEDVYCGSPEVRLGTGGAEFEDVERDDALPLHFGSNGGSGGYDMFLSVEMERLCPIVWLEPKVEARVDGAWETIYTERLHVLAVRPQEGSSEQVYWGIRAPIPCAFWPDDPSRDATCGTFQSRRGFVNDLPLRVSVSAEDHDGRLDVDEREVVADCCGE